MNIYLREVIGAIEMVQCVKVLTTEPDNLSSIPEIDMATRKNQLSQVVF